MANYAEIIGRMVESEGRKAELRKSFRETKRLSYAKRKLKELKSGGQTYLLEGQKLKRKRKKLKKKKKMAGSTRTAGLEKQLRVNLTQKEVDRLRD